MYRWADRTKSHGQSQNLVIFDDFGSLGRCPFAFLTRQLDRRELDARLA